MKSRPIQEHKSFLRHELRQAVKKITKNSRRHRSQKISRSLMRSAEFKRAHHIMIYVPIAGEVDTRDFLSQAFCQDKNIYIPKINSTTKKMTPIQIKNPKSELKRGTYGIMEPHGRHLKRLNPAKLDLVIVPGLGFDRSGGRLGRGVGYFDRFLKRAKKAKTIGLAFREQIRKKIPMERHDVYLDRVMIG